MREGRDGAAEIALVGHEPVRLGTQVLHLRKIAARDAVLNGHRIERNDMRQDIRDRAFQADAAPRRRAARDAVWTAEALGHTDCRHRGALARRQLDGRNKHAKAAAAGVDRQHQRHLHQRAEAGLIDLDRLIDKIILPPDLVDPVTDIGTLQAATDRLAVLQAVAILFPLAARKVLLPKYAEGRLTLADIEDLAEVPVRYVAMVMSAEWEEIHELLLDLEIPREEPRAVPTPDRVSPLNPDGTIFEVHSVPIGVDALTYARSLVERDRKDSQPPRSYMIDRKGVQSTHTAEEVIKLSSRQ